jgi:uncharacterized membrane protein
MDLTEIEERHDGENFSINCILIYTKTMNQIQEFTWLVRVVRMEQQKDYWIMNSVLTASSQLSNNTDIFAHPYFISRLKWEKWNW